MPAASPLPPFASTFDALISSASLALSRERIIEMHQAFEKRTGAFGPDDAWFEVRSRAFWDDAMTRQGAASSATCTPEEEPWKRALSRSHRGLFHAKVSGGEVVLVDVWSGIELFVHELADGSRDDLAAPTGPFDGTVVACDDPVRLALLPGAVFHPAAAEKAISDLLALARTRDLPTETLLDALLRMELSFRTLSRVKPAYAYRAEALAAPRAAASSPALPTPPP